MSHPFRIALLALAAAAAVPSTGAGQAARDPRLHDAWVARRKYDGTYLRLVGDSISGSASAPEGIALTGDGPAGREGEVLVVFYDALRIKDIEPGGLASIRSLDGGETWSTRRPVVLRGKRNEGACIDPALVPLPDGRIRLYFVACPEELPPQAWPPETREVHSAVSIDGVHFEVEDGARLALWGVRSPSVLRSPDGEWWMFFSSGEETLLARSSDGLNFDLDPTFVCEEGWSPGAIADPEVGVRLFVTAKEGILEIPVDAGGGLGLPTLALPVPPGAGGVGDPSPVRLPDGAELLVYRQVPHVKVVIPKPLEPPKKEPVNPRRPAVEPVKPRKPAPLGPQRPRGVPRRRTG